MKRFMAVWTVILAVAAVGCVADVETADEGEAGGALVSEAPEEELQAPIKWPFICTEKGPACMERCADEGISCASGRKHPHKPEVGLGLLAACAKLGANICAFDYKNGERCVFIGGIPRGLCEVL